MLKNLSWLLLSLTVVLPVAPCPAQEEPAKEPNQPAIPRAADLTIPELVATADQYRANKRYSEAKRALELVLRRERANVEALRMLGNIAWEMKEAENARKYWLLVLQARPNDFDANWGLGRVHLGSGIYRNAMRYLEVATSVVPAEPAGLASEVLIALAQACRGSGLRAKALDVVQRALALDPDNYEAWSVLAAVRTESAFSADDLDNALHDAERLVEIASNELKTAGVTRTGVERLQSAYELELEVLYSYGKVLFERNPDGTLSDRLLPGREKLAAGTMRKTVDVMLRQADLQRTLTHFRVLAIAAKAVEFDGGTDPNTLMDLGLLQKVTGRLDAAIATFQKVLELDPLNQTAQRELDALQAQRRVSEGSTPGVSTP